ncbi:hypothetical protein [Catenovulum maritimum]|uniref:Uncharacterized protein n=1 Tax=Catenovulum maritimum TaxID=1513271 RepID=A0A0J8GX33_9ALTE|nr:hypothetical protein [Catenovulum maritimum]KMT65824.1 hypothetical protein XM47_07450 [Catenovulum maritimum]
MLNQFWQKIGFSKTELTLGIFAAISATIATYSLLFAIGAWLYTDVSLFAILIFISTVTGFVCYKLTKKAM